MGVLGQGQSSSNPTLSGDETASRQAADGDDDRSFSSSSDDDTDGAAISNDDDDIQSDNNEEKYSPSMDEDSDVVPYVGTIDHDALVVVSDDDVIAASSPSSAVDDDIDDNKDEGKVTLSEEDEYRLQAYGTTDKYNENDNDNSEHQQQGRAFRRLSRQFSQSINKGRASFVESLPETPAGWTVLLTTAASALLGYEIQLQQSLTAPPLVFGQVVPPSVEDDNSKQGATTTTSLLQRVYQHMAATPQSILRRNIQPSLFVGTRGLVASTAAYAMGGPGAKEQHLQFRQILRMPQDGAQVGLDWELPAIDLIQQQQQDSSRSHHPTIPQSDEERKAEILNGPIRTSVVLILHGINNHAGFGYVRSLMRACCNKGWTAVGMNFRGCGGVPLTTPRAYTGAYTGDLRGVVQHIVARLDEGNYLFLVGNSLGANLVAKYLGEEGLSGTLPPQVAGGVTLGNPMNINSGKMNRVFSPLLTLGVKKGTLENWSTIRQMNDKHFQATIRKAMCSLTLGAWDNAMAPVFARNDPIYPFAFRTGYKDGNAYWNDASSYRLVRFIPVPTLQLMAADDTLCYNNFKNTFGYNLANPNLMVVETTCGGHLGWQESPPKRDQLFGITGTSWSDVLTTDFIEAILHAKREAGGNEEKLQSPPDHYGHSRTIHHQMPHQQTRPVLRSRL